MSNKISLVKIPTDIKYEGYLWWSDQENPEVFKSENLKSKIHELWPSETHNPFIIEGNLWDSIDETSFLIRFIDGKYLVYEFKIKDIDPKCTTELEYLPNRMPTDIKNLKFKEVWTAQPDPFCEGFEVLKPAFIAFVGFKYQKEVKK